MANQVWSDLDWSRKSLAAPGKLLASYRRRDGAELCRRETNRLPRVLSESAVSC